MDRSGPEYHGHIEREDRPVTAHVNSVAGNA